MIYAAFVILSLIASLNGLHFEFRLSVSDSPLIVPGVVFVISGAIGMLASFTVAWFILQEGRSVS